ncbi:MAG: DUF4394 domain-containing protein [Hymenobacter sp.]
MAGGNLISFDSGAPSTIRSAVNFGGGITVGETTVGIDFRPATGQLYALGYNATAGTATVYAVNLTTGSLTAAGPAIALALGAATDRVGFDFNPTVDRIRVVATNGNNYRLNPNNGALVIKDGNLTAGAAVGAAAYTNSSSAANSTALYDYDAVAGQLYLQNPPNDGTLVAVGGAGGPASADGADLDIFNTRGTTTNAAFLAVAPGGVAGAPAAFDNLYTVDLTAGTTASAGRIGLGSNVGGLTAFIATSTALTWNGSASTDWGTAANWTPNRRAHQRGRRDHPQRHAQPTCRERQPGGPLRGAEQRCYADVQRRLDPDRGRQLHQQRRHLGGHGFRHHRPGRHRRPGHRRHRHSAFQGTRPWARPPPAWQALAAVRRVLLLNGQPDRHRPARCRTLLSNAASTRPTW